jgi:hypothetical protein
MHPKSVVFRAPLDSQAPQLEQLLTAITATGLKFTTGTYLGNGAERTVALASAPEILIIIPKFPPNTTYPVIQTASNQLSITFRVTPKITWIPGFGYVADAVTSLSHNAMTLGVNAAVNSISQEYAYILIG